MKGRRYCPHEATKFAGFRSNGVVRSLWCEDCGALASIDLKGDRTPRWELPRKRG